MQGTVATLGGISFGCRRLSRQIASETDLRAVSLILSVVVGACMLHRIPAVGLHVAKAPAPPPAVALTVASNPYGELIDPGFFRSKPDSPAKPLWLEAALEPFPAAPTAAPATEAAPSMATAPPENVPLPPKREVSEPAEGAPLPPPRPAELEEPASTPAPVRHSAEPSVTTAAAPATPTDNRTFIEKLFGLAPHSGTASGPALGYAAPETSAIGRSSAASTLSEPHPAPAVAFAAPESSAVGRGATTSSLPGRGGGFGSWFGFTRSAPSPTSLGYDQYTAIYDLSAHTVYLPNGTRLEAHSGLGDRLDDPNHVNERMRGATPPHLYELEPREASFHGVQALRLTPIGGGDIFGRAGLLAHTYMLGPNGDSNGCVSFKDYDAFLRAYQNGEIRKLAVVARL
jgi:hypothetical protein